MLQATWALIANSQGTRIEVRFIANNSGVLNRMHFDSREACGDLLRRIGFRRFAEDAHEQSVLHPPLPPFREWAHPNGPIYSD